MIAGIVIVLCLIAGGVLAALAVSQNNSSDFTVTIENCSINADGTVVASGKISSDESRSAEVTVHFRDADTSTDLGTKLQTVDSSWDGTAWTATSQVGDSVQRVTCTAST